MADDTEFEELLDGLEGEAREARRRLIEELLDDGCAMDTIRQAVAEGRLALLPAERILEVEAQHSLRDMADEVGVDVGALRRARAAYGLTLGDDDDVRFGAADLEVTRNLRAVLDSGVPLESIVQFNRVVGRSMLQIAAASRGMLADAMFRPGTTEHALGVAGAAAARELVPRMSPTLRYVYESHLRELLRSDVVNAADIAAGRTPGAREMTIAFADLVGFTRLGEEVPAEELGDVVGRLEAAAGDVIAKPVTLVKTIGDAVMFVSAAPDAAVDTALRLVTAVGDDEALQLRVGVAWGAALERAGDWYGSPVNQASRVTGIARPGSVLVTESVKENAESDWSWSFARERKLKGVGEVKLFRVRRPADEG